MYVPPVVMFNGPLQDVVAWLVVAVGLVVVVAVGVGVRAALVGAAVGVALVAAVVGAEVGLGLVVVVVGVGAGVVRHRGCPGCLSQNEDDRWAGSACTVAVKPATASMSVTQRGSTSLNFTVTPRTFRGWSAGIEVRMGASPSGLTGRGT